MQLDASTLAVLAQTPATLRSLLASLPPERVSAAGSEGWSPLDVVAHVLSIDEPILIGRLQLIFNEDHPSLPNIGEELADISGMRAWALGRLLDEFASQRAVHVAALQSLSAAELARGGRHALAGDITG